MENKFKEKYSFEKRKNESSKVYQIYPDRVPIIVQKHFSSELPEVNKCKYLVPREMNLGQFIYIIRKRIKLDSHQALFVTVNCVLGSSSTVISELYDNHKDEDGFLYVVYTSENTFG